MNIKTNNVPREVLQAWQLSSFVRYRGKLYDLGEFVRIERRSQLINPFRHGVDDDSPLLNWQGIQTDSFFSAIVIRYADTNCETVIVGEATI